MEVVIVEIVVEIRKTKVLDSVAELETSPPPDFVPGQHPPRELLPFAAVFVPPILNSHVLWKSIQAYNPLGEPTSVQTPQHGLSKSCGPRACQATFHYATPTSPSPNHVQAPTMRTPPTSQRHGPRAVKPPQRMSSGFLTAQRWQTWPGGLSSCAHMRDPAKY